MHGGTMAAGLQKRHDTIIEVSPLLEGVLTKYLYTPAALAFTMHGQYEGTVAAGLEKWHDTIIEVSPLLEGVLTQVK